ncbi:MAG: NAD(P)H-hydrate dehydratase [Thermodesulfovibrio sp.]|nr:NAD(P)H-hydrate dehydratase [Thermodesulfovibrio sp.]
MKVVTSEEMSKIDSLTIEKYGIPSLVLMERAALSVSKHLIDLGLNKLIILAGPGNNGGDGIAIGRILKNKNIDTKIYQLFSDDKLSNECKLQINIAEKFKIPIFKRYPTKKELSEADIILDAIFGTGLKRKIEGELEKLVKLINSLKKLVVAVDIPSGISSDTGEILGCAIKANITITFGLPKRGHFLFPGRDYTGKLFIEDIGFPRDLTESEELKVSLINREFVCSLIPARPFYSHKGTYGHVLVIAGSLGKTGAALMTAKACLRTGSGLVTMAIPESLNLVFQSQVLEEMLISLPCNSHTLSKESIPEILKFINEKADVVAFGPGVGINEDTEEILKSILKDSSCPVIIDADGITLLSRNRELLSKAKIKTIITPHPGELSRLIKISVKEIEKQRIEIAQKVAKELKTVVVLKGVPTVIADHNEITFINSTGNPGMATGGAGDVLTGIIASLIGQGLSPLNAAVLGVYLHGMAGDIGSIYKGCHGLIARDIIDNIPNAIKSLTDEIYRKY